MTRATKRSLAVVSLVAAACLLCATLAQARKPDNPSGGGGGGSGPFPGFAVVDLGEAARGEAINDLGKVVGSMGNRAAFWSVDPQGVAQMLLLPEPAGYQSFAEDVNYFSEAVGGENRRDAAGNSFAAALLWRITPSGVTVVELPPLPGDSDSYAYAISDTGLIVGSSQAYDAVNREFLDGSAVVWQIGSQNDVHLFEIPTTGNDAVAADVNNPGQVLVRDDYGANNFGVWQLNFDGDGIVTGAVATDTLPTLGGSHIEPGSIKDFSQITGGAETADGEMHPVIWHLDAAGLVTGITDLGTIDRKHDLAAANDVNSIGWAAGNICTLTTKGGNIRLDCSPFLSVDGAMTNLNGLLVDDAGFKDLWPVLGMNEPGWICGRGEKGRQSHGYVAIPLP